MTMMSNIPFENLLKLRRSPSKLGLAPHKPVLLLTLINLIENKATSSNCFELNDHLYLQFERTWNAYVKTKHTLDIKQPFYHLQNDCLYPNEPIWEAVTFDGVTLDRPIAGAKKFSQIVQFGRLHPDLYTWLQDKDNLAWAQLAIKDAYFGNELIGKI